MTAIIILIAFSFVDWETVSQGRFKSFDLLGDIRPGGTKIKEESTAKVYIDPDLEELIKQEQDIQEVCEKDANVRPLEDISESPLPLKEDEQEKEIEDSKKAEEIKNIVTASFQKDDEPVNTTKPENEPETEEIKFEDYSFNHQNIQKLRKSLGQTHSRLVRIAVIGDSYIEGDIFTEGIRYRLQERYGGEGVGYVPLYSEIAGFRRSVNQNCTGWENKDFKTKLGREYSLIQGVVSVSIDGQASTTYNGSAKVAGTEKWSLTRLLFATPSGGKFRIKSGKGKDIPWDYVSFVPNDSIRMIETRGETDRFSIAGVSEGVIFLGAYLDGEKGIAVDNMSIRGYAGIRHDEIKEKIANECRRWINYDMIIVEYGINALSSSQNNYTAYENKMVEVINHLKELYPDAVILIMGVGDRGERRGGEIHSMSTIPVMIEAQRRIARRTGSLFWNTQNAMGGEDAVVEWVKNKEINKDYIHLSFQGGNRLASLFIQSLDNSL